MAAGAVRSPRPNGNGTADPTSPSRDELCQRLLETSSSGFVHKLSSLSLKRRITRGSLLTKSRSDLQETLAWLEGEEEAQEEARAQARARQAAAAPDIEAERTDEGSIEADETTRVLPPTEPPVEALPTARSDLGAASALTVAKTLSLPALLFTSTLAAAASMLVVQRALVRAFFGDSFLFTAVAAPVYGLTLGCMCFTALADPGQLSGEALSGWQAGGILPRRAHKNWRYERPILRFDHYCRWIANCIGLYNHRSFMVMTASIVAGALLGFATDVTIGIARLVSPYRVVWAKSALVELWLSAHLIYCAALLYFSVPILRLHVGFVSRNELAKEWKHDDFYILRKSPVGEPVWVNDLDVEEYNNYFDQFEYDPSRNTFDKGCGANCFAFWCTVRRAPGQLGEF